MESVLARIDFWGRWLVIANAIAVGVGLVIAFAGDSVLLAPHNARTAEVFFRGAITPEAERLKAWLFGVLGGTLVGFHVLAIFVAHGPFRRGERWAHRALTCALVSWFVIDSGLSIRYGAIHNVILVNLVAVVGLGLPLAMTWRALARASH